MIDFSKIKDLVIEGKLEDALIALKELVESTEVKNYISILQSRISYNSRDIRLGIKTQEDFNTERNRIIKLTLELISELSFKKSSEVEKYIRESIKENLPPILLFERESINNILGLVKYSRICPPLIVYKIAMKVFISINEIISEAIENNYDGYHGYPNSGGIINSVVFGNKTIKESGITNLKLRYTEPKNLEKAINKFVSKLEDQYEDAEELVDKKFTRRILMVFSVGDEYFLKELARAALKVYLLYISIILKSIYHSLGMQEKNKIWNTECKDKYEIFKEEVLPYLKEKKFRHYNSRFYSNKESTDSWLERECSFLGLKYEDFKSDGSYSENMSEDEHGTVYLYKIKKSQRVIIKEKFKESVK